MRILVLSQEEVTVLAVAYSLTPSAKAFDNGTEELLRGNPCSFVKMKLSFFWLTKYNLLNIPPNRYAPRRC